MGASEVDMADFCHKKWQKINFNFTGTSEITNCTGELKKYIGRTEHWN